MVEFERRSVRDQPENHCTIQMMKEQHIEGVVDVIPAFCSLLINYDPRVVTYGEIRERQKIVRLEVKAGEDPQKDF